MNIVAVTGATGFVGSALCSALAGAHRVRRLLRAPASPRDGCEDIVVGDLADAALDAACQGAEAVIHLAARTHVMREHAADAEAAYRRINVEGTRRLAEAAVRAGVRRCVFLSSIKVNGEATHGAPYTEASIPAPEDAYGRSKLEAEQTLAAVANTAMDTVVLRPPLLYGPGVKGNLLTLLRALARGLPLPLAAIDNRRSMLGLDNLVCALMLAMTHPAAAGRTFLVADGEDLSSPQLARLIAAGLGTPARLLPVPAPLLMLAGTLTGKRAAVARLTGSLQIDAGAIRSALSWRPPVPAAEGLARMGRWYDREVIHSKE
ncbi:MAG: NAD-dependent epimerase/dehydratase family protein [Burkholderiales bacterium]